MRMYAFIQITLFSTQRRIMLILFEGLFPDTALKKTSYMSKHIRL